mmetsp:Transcript_7811/g.13916  ORF Transcript_7811/g.13916 Transcript_7811/m.13916 type:complete len:258 (-) Transcript_7811:249-1022(-)
MPTIPKIVHSIGSTVVYNTLIAAVGHCATQALTISRKRGILHQWLAKDHGTVAIQHMSDGDSKGEERELQLVHVVHFAFSVGTVGAVLGTTWYEYVVPSIFTSRDHSMLSCAKKVVLSNIVFLPLVNACQLSCLSLLEHGKDAIIPRLSEEWPRVCSAGFIYWFPLKMLMFAYIRPSMQVLFLSGVGLVWNILLGFLLHLNGPEPQKSSSLPEPMKVSLEVLDRCRPKEMMTEDDNKEPHVSTDQQLPQTTPQLVDE